MTKVVNFEVGSLPDGTPTCTFYTPSRMKITVREQNGEDDDILTKMKDNKDGTAMHKYVAQIVTAAEGYEMPLKPEQVASWKVRDKYYVIFKSRRFSLGDLLTFDHLFEGETKPISFDEDLCKYDWDFSSEENPKKKGEIDYDKNIFQPYPKSKDGYAPELELTLNPRHKGWKVRYKYLTGNDEREALGMNTDDMAINDKLRFRHIELSRDGVSFQEIQTFGMLSSLDMQDIRTHLATHDPDFNLTVEVRNPLTGARETPGLMQVEGFFFPAG